MTYRAATPLTGRDLVESLALLVAVGFTAVLFTEVADRLRRRLLSQIGN